LLYWPRLVSRMGKVGGLRDVFILYRRQPVGIRFFVRMRSLLCPMERLETLVPQEGRILDLGCGHGLFTNLLALRGPDRQILGCDPSAAKIGVAAAAGLSLSNVRYQVGYLADVSATELDGITILDVLYLLPPAEKRAVIRGCYERLKPGGVLMVKTNDRSPRWKFAVAYGEEVLMTKAGLTFGGNGLHFFSAAENRAYLEEAGFSVRVVDLNSWLPYPHVAFVCRKLER